MSAQQIKVRRGTDAQRQGVTLAEGEPAFTTDTKQLFLGDGQTQGGLAVTPAEVAAHLVGVTPGQAAANKALVADGDGRFPGVTHDPARFVETGNGKPLLPGFNRVTDSDMKGLPAAVDGLVVTVANFTQSALTIFAAGTDKIKTPGSGLSGSPQGDISAEMCVIFTAHDGWWFPVPHDAIDYV